MPNEVTGTAISKHSDLLQKGCNTSLIDSTLAPRIYRDLLIRSMTLEGK